MNKNAVIAEASSEIGKEVAKLLFKDGWHWAVAANDGKYYLTIYDFVNYIIDIYIKESIEELGYDKLPTIISIKYGSILDGRAVLCGVEVVGNVFLEFQRNLYLNHIVS